MNNSDTINLTGIRGIAVLLVLTAHTPVRQIIGDFGQQAVYIFFFLSAYLLTISLERQSLTKFYTKRFWRIYPLYFILIVIFGLIGSISLGTIVSNLLFVQQISGSFILSVSWSLIIEVELYLLLPLITKLLRKYGIKALIGFILCGYLVRFSMFPEYLVRADSGSMKVVFGTIFEFIDMFAIASYIAISRRKIKQCNNKVINSRVLQVIVGCIFISIPRIVEVTGINRAIAVISILMPLYTILIIAIFCWLIAKQGLINWICNSKILIFYGTISYSLYLLQLPILQMVREFNVNLVVQGIISIILLSCVSYASYRFIELKFSR